MSIERIYASRNMLSDMGASEHLVLPVNSTVVVMSSEIVNTSFPPVKDRDGSCRLPGVPRRESCILARVLHDVSESARMLITCIQFNEAFINCFHRAYADLGDSITQLFTDRGYRVNIMRPDEGKRVGYSAELSCQDILSDFSNLTWYPVQMREYIFEGL